MPEAAYPLLVRKRRRRLRLPSLGLRARPIAIGLVAFTGVMAGVYAATRPEPVDVAAAIAASSAALAAGNYNAARANAQQALREEPRSVDAPLLLARAFLELENGVAAEAELARSRELGAKGLRPLLAQARMLQGDAEGALALLGGATGPEATRVRARALAAKGGRAEATALLEELVRRDPTDARGWAELGRLRFSGGEVGGADIAAARAASLAPGDPVALTLKGEIVRSRFGLVASLPWFEAALKRDAYHFPALVEYAATLGELGRNRDMLAAARAAALARPGAPEPLYLQAVLAARAARPELARAVLAHAGPAAEAMPGAMLLAGALDQAQGKHEQAAERWRALLRVQPLNFLARRLLAAALLRSGDPAGALGALQPLVLRADADPYALSLAARASEARGDREGAARLLDRAAANGRGMAAAFASDASIAALLAGAAGAPGDPTYAAGLIRGYAATGQTAAAIGAAQSLARATTGAPDAQTALGDAYAAGGRWLEAADVYARAADLRFDEPALLRLVDALGRAGRVRQAAEALSLYLSQNPQSVLAHRLLGQWQLSAGDWEAAIETLEGLRAKIGSADAGLLAELARAYAGDGDGVVARRYGAAAYALAPMSPVVVAAYAAALSADGDREGARQLAAKLRALGG